jgi:uncharacterized Zn finger protein (UPF0148 family)
VRIILDKGWRCPRCGCEFMYSSEHAGDVPAPKCGMGHELVEMEQTSSRGELAMGPTCR